MKNILKNRLTQLALILIVGLVLGWGFRAMTSDNTTPHAHEAGGRPTFDLDLLHAPKH